MCTSIVSNRHKTLIGWNLDMLDMEYQVVAEDKRVYITVYDEKAGWMQLFGVTGRGEFVTMPTCWPYDERSDSHNDDDISIMELNMDLLMNKRTFDEVRQLLIGHQIVSAPKVTYQA